MLNHSSGMRALIGYVLLNFTSRRQGVRAIRSGGWSEIQKDVAALRALPGPRLNFKHVANVVAAGDMNG